MSGQKRLYIIMRTDMHSLNAGKAMAQAAHAANDAHGNLFSKKSWKEWMAETSYFGTTIVLSDELDSSSRSFFPRRVKLDDICNKLSDLGHSDFGITTDPTYPIKDGDTMHFPRVDVCMWVFLDTEDDHKVFDYISDFKLHA